jgi:hypothetical protein
VLALKTNYDTLKFRKSFWYDPVVHDFTSSAHYDTGGLNVSFIHEQLKKVHDGIPISVSSCLAPHLTNRDKIYHFPVINDAQLIVLLKDKRSHYPLNQENFTRETNRLISNSQYHILVDQYNLLILQKNKSR